MSHAGERLDQLCQRVYGRQAGVVEAILGRQPELAVYDPCLPAGVWIDCPSLSALGISDRPAMAVMRQWWE